MNLKDLLARFVFKKRQQPEFPQRQISGNDPEMMRKMLGMLANTQETEFTCEDVFAVLDQFVELAARGENVKSLMPLVQQHIDMCPDCREEYEALQRVLFNST
jgi:hypothetical protein